MIVWLEIDKLEWQYRLKYFLTYIREERDLQETEEESAVEKTNENLQDEGNPFYRGMEEIVIRNSDISRVPWNRYLCESDDCNRSFPSSVDLSVNVMATYSDAIVSLKYAHGHLRLVFWFVMRGKWTVRCLSYLCVVLQLRYGS